MSKHHAEPAIAPAIHRHVAVVGSTEARQPPNRDQVDRMIAAAPNGIGAPARIDVGDLALGKHTEVEVVIWNLDDAAEAGLRVDATGNAAVRVVSVPERLRPSSHGFDASRVVRLEFRPHELGRVHATLQVAMAWANATRPPETIEIDIVGGAHAPGGPNLDDQDAIKASEALRVQAEAARDAERGRVDRVIHNELAQDVHYHSGNKIRLEQERDAAAAALTALYAHRQNGLTRAEAAIGTFVRQPTPQDDSLLASLAYYALDLASASIAGGVAKAIEPTVKTVLGSPGLTGVITDGIKFLVKDGGKQAHDKLKQKHAVQDVAPSDDARADFMLAHREILVDDQHAHVNDVMARAYEGLLPTLRREPEKAIGAMHATTVAIEQQHGVADIQLHETSLQWIRYVAQHSLGSVAVGRGGQLDGHSTLTDLRKANVPLDDHTPLARRDGLLDITFKADEVHPEKPVEVTRMRLTGVRKGVAAQLLGPSPLLALGLPVRASGFLGGPTSSVTITRDEAGSVAFTDHTTVPWEQATWLARKAGVMIHGSQGDELRGAQILIEDEIMSRPVSALASKGKLETDSAE